MVVAAKGWTCPLGDASMHGITITVGAYTKCADLEQEMKDRIRLQDKHPAVTYGGKYAVEENVPTGGTVATSRLDASGQPTLKQVYTLSPVKTPEGDDVCKIQACANSLVPASIGSSYCDLKMLYCDGGDGCSPMHQVFTIGPETLEAAGTFTKESLDVHQCLYGTDDPGAAKGEKAEATVIV